MAFNILEEDIETFVLFAIAPVYFVILSVIQNKHLKNLKKIENKYIKKEVKKSSLNTIRRLKKRTPLYLLIGAAVHLIGYLIFVGPDFRYGYFISIVFFYAIFWLIMYINFILKGASILKDTGDFGGLPGN